MKSTVVTLVGVLALVGAGIGAAFALRTSPPAPPATRLSASVAFPGSAAQTWTEGAASVDGGPAATADGLQTWTVGSGPQPQTCTEGGPQTWTEGGPQTWTEGGPQTCTEGGLQTCTEGGLQTCTEGGAQTRTEGAANVDGGPQPQTRTEGAASLDGGPQPQALSLESGAAPGPDREAAADVDGETRPNADGLIYAREYRHWLYEPNTGVSFFWQNDATTLYVGVISPGTGWVSVGLGGHGDRAGTSTVVGCVRNGKVVLEDRYGALGSQRRRAREPRFLAAGGTELHGETTLEFTIPLASGDRELANLVPGGTIGVTFARHGTKDDFAVEQACCGTTWIPLD
ncbi:MAG: hypothetical protein PHU43_08845 [Candidatus Bipolaricaulis sp.]|nr:hypothetical protein [Candidatus Bipolaricaulis sp.]